MQVAGWVVKDNKNWKLVLEKIKNVKSRFMVALTQKQENLSKVMGVTFYGDLFYTPKSLPHCSIFLVDLFTN